MIDAIEHAGITDQITDRLKARETDKIHLEQEVANIRLKLKVPPAPDALQVDSLREMIEIAA